MSKFDELAPQIKEALAAQDVTPISEQVQKLQLSSGQSSAGFSMRSGASVEGVTTHSEGVYTNQALFTNDAVLTSNSEFSKDIAGSYVNQATFTKKETLNKQVDESKITIDKDTLHVTSTISVDGKVVRSFDKDVAVDKEVLQSIKAAYNQALQKKPTKEAFQRGMEQLDELDTLVVKYAVNDSKLDQVESQTLINKARDVGAKGR